MIIGVGRYWSWIGITVAELLRLFLDARRKLNKLTGIADEWG